MENLIYTWVQIVHNFGAVAVVGSPAVGNREIRFEVSWLEVLV